MPTSCEATVVLGAHLHARPAGAVVRAVAPFTGTVEVSHAGRTANARSILALMGLGATAGSTVTVRAEGEDPAAAVAAVVDVLGTTE
jgi:phosphocarrier protein HPr